GQEIDAIHTEVVGVMGDPDPPRVTPFGDHNLRASRLPLPVVELALKRLIHPAISLLDVLTQGDLLHVIGKGTVGVGRLSQGDAPVSGIHRYNPAVVRALSPSDVLP